MMELKVWVEGIQRIVCGVTETTTCQVKRILLLPKKRTSLPLTRVYFPFEC